MSQSACLYCRHRKTCPYSCDRVLESSLHRTAHQGKAAAQLLTAEAEQLLEAISLADDVRCLLHADEAMARTLHAMLHAELSSMNSFSALP